ncbi:PilZ domain-containing protein [Paludisphaera sp.]|uniref:PilZ domain-containing protein n=1 Tax=Paludisphaera sp. TaxID=2017432 RepID=UPI00301C29A9
MRVAGLRLRGDAPQLNNPVLDRRHWPRRETPFAEAALSWVDRRVESRMEIRVVNLSVGGAGLIVPVVPPLDAVLHLDLGTRRGPTVVEGRAVATREDPDTGWTFLHMEFTRGCPEHVLDRIVDHWEAD